MTITLEMFKLAVLSPDECSDRAVEKLFLATAIIGEDDIRQMGEILSMHRPQLTQLLARKYFTLHTAS